MAKRPLSQTLIAALGVALLCLSQLALSSKDFYKWEDEDGVTHYSAHPSKDHASSKVRATNIKGSETSSAAATEDSAKPATQATEELPKDPQRCAQAKKNLKTLQEKSRVRIKEGDDYRYLAPEEVAEQIKTAQQIIKEEC